MESNSADKSSSSPIIESILELEKAQVAYDTQLTKTEPFNSIEEYNEWLMTQSLSEDLDHTKWTSSKYEFGGWPFEPRQIMMIIADVDNTIVDSSTGKNYVSPELAGALHKFNNSGRVIGLATGRSWSMLKPLMENLGLIGPQTISDAIKNSEKNNQPLSIDEQNMLNRYKSNVIAAVDGGARIVNMDGETIWGNIINKQSVKNIVDILTDLNLTSVFWSDENKDFSREDLEIGWDLGDLDQSTNLYFLGVRAIGLEREKVNDIASLIRSKVEDINVSVAEAQYNPGFCDFHITDKKASKKGAAEEMMIMHHIDPGFVLAAGDGGNDIDLFEACGVKYAVGNAVQSLKERADIIGPSIIFDGQENSDNEEHGFLSLLNTINEDSYRTSKLGLTAIELSDVDNNKIRSLTE